MSRDAPWAGHCAVDTPWPNTLEVSLGPKAEQDRREPSNWRLVNERLQFTTQCLHTLGTVGCPEWAVLHPSNVI